jgi:ketosteroid isomerase-like protein
MSDASTSTSPREDDTLVLETARIRAVLERYFHALDARDAESLASCFSEAAQVAYRGTGAEFMMRGNTAIAHQLIRTVGRFTATIHALSNTVIVVSGSTATADSFAVAHVIADGQALVRGLRYRDALTKTATGWRIETRSHEPLWQYDVPTVLPHVPS